MNEVTAAEEGVAVGEGAIIGEAAEAMIEETLIGEVDEEMTETLVVVVVVEHSSVEVLDQGHHMLDETLGIEGHTVLEVAPTHTCLEVVIMVEEGMSDDDQQLQDRPRHYLYALGQIRALRHRAVEGRHRDLVPLLADTAL